ncbi:Transposon Ty3-I Gag-Pol polyprotein [Quillaja saponaria]|uniref:Transposon Ty3-I Gag-Pol polyprotein n=1 Tax=Quillaja saponaria TaxID=32244 RepID=A0AAD7M314_QUISA|nr:Transposon Ty3-I Gag-Pol polyprotein [Quillaja saponaria]
MVKKSNGKWWMYVDFTNLSKASPKNSYPLPRINRLVDSATGNELLSFMDAYSDYNQILMKEENQEKTLCITKKGTYCYKIMPFGLKTT